MWYYLSKNRTHPAHESECGQSEIGEIRVDFNTMFSLRLHLQFLRCEIVMHLGCYVFDHKVLD